LGHFGLKTFLFRFAVKSVFVAETTIFLGFHAFWVVLFFFHGLIVALFAICARQRYLCSHGAHLCHYDFTTQKNTPGSAANIISYAVHLVNSFLASLKAF